MKLTYRRATMEDIDVLVEIRLEVLRAVNHLSEEEDLSHMEKASYAYYRKFLPTDEHIAYIARLGEEVVGGGSIGFYHIMPTYTNPTGTKAYIMNVYTRPEYRRQGIAFKTLDCLLEEARNRGVDYITLKSTLEGRKLYESYGFQKMEREMEIYL
ncbi:MAG: GNAT family N-acetyltransferase [Lachnospiraceae bacterium]|nr:GNAT family N-acetyltransferase [Lachnospiraceae bacterium]